MSTGSLEELLRESAEQYVRNAAVAFLEGEQSFASVTHVLAAFGFPKKTTERLLSPLRNHGDSFRAAALFHWIDLREW